MMVMRKISLRGHEEGTLRGSRLKMEAVLISVTLVSVIITRLINGVRTIRPKNVWQFCAQEINFISNMKSVLFW